MSSLKKQIDSSRKVRIFEDEQQQKKFEEINNESIRNSLVEESSQKIFVIESNNEKSEMGNITLQEYVWRSEKVKDGMVEKGEAFHGCPHTRKKSDFEILV